METVVGIFTSLDKAESAVKQLQTLGLPEKQIVLLTPGSAHDAADEVATTEAEAPGIGQALGATVGGAMGVAGGFSLGAAAASLVIPGVGPIIAAGILGAAILGLGGAATGSAVGEALEEGLEVGLPHDELYIYEDALRKGRTVVIAFAGDEEQAERSRTAMSQSGAESIDSAREDWWLGLRDAEEELYQGSDFKSDEVSYRRGFEAALNRKFRGRAYHETTSELEAYHEGASSDEAFQRGYDRGLAYQKGLEATTSK